LVVDDSSFARKLMIRRIEQATGYTTRQAADGAQALDAVRTHRPDLVLLDLTMPVMDGYQFLTELREFDAELPVVVVTADVQRRAKERVMALGANAIFAKPFGVPELKDLLDDLL